jgi:hypothetical protein
MGESGDGERLAAPAAAAIETAYASEFNLRRAVFRPGQARKQPAWAAGVMRADLWSTSERTTGVRQARDKA